jgi:oligopeptide/dipeptide ABC transporter ATP-binding protein
VEASTSQSSTIRSLLEVSELSTYFFTDDGVVKAVDGVDLAVQSGEIFGLVGESGCGKSVTALSILRLIEAPGRTVEGEVYFNGIELLELVEKDMADIRGKDISMIFQQPQSSLNPVFTVGTQIAEVFQIHEGMRRSDAWEKAAELLQRVGIPDPERRVRSYPHELSGGQAQRVMIAMALALRPRLLIADEPTTALDVTIQAQILDLMRQMSRDSNTAVILITHDLGVIAEMAARVAVMYAGHIVEQAEVTALFDQPLHPYTHGLIASIPIQGADQDRLETIPGTVPNLVDLPSGCRFAPRCQARIDYDLEICNTREPDLINLPGGHAVRCYLYQNFEEHHAPLADTIKSPQAQ